MIGLYLLSAFVIAGLVFANRKIIFNNILIILFAIIQICFTIYAGFHYKESMQQYFTFDSLGLLLLMTLSIITIPALFHSYIYLERHNETPQSRAIYFSAIIVLITSISAAYLANHIAVIWIFT
ncbi:MAG TPA: hypothetical protein VFE71_04710, partial [Bacteroidales bacterium]|nr:hypothetical protein [Bacteroidales bacterium]